MIILMIKISTGLPFHNIPPTGYRAANVIDIFHSRSPIKQKSYGTTETENDVMTSQYLVNG